MIALSSPIRAGAAALLTGAALLVAGCGGGAAFKATRTAHVAHAAGSPVRVATDNGYVELVRGQTDDVEITAHIAALTQERLDATKVAVVREASGLLQISVDWPGSHRKGSEGCSFEVKVPDAVGVTIETSNGHIKLAGLAGQARLETSNGSIDVADHNGDARAHTSNGSLEMRGVAGKATAKTSNGGIVLADVSGEAWADTSNGDVQIELAPDSPGPVFVDSSNGSVRLELGPAFDGVVDLRTTNGRITVDGAEASGDKGHKTFKVGTGSRESTVSTSNGRVHALVKR